MHSSLKGAKENSGLTIGILPDNNKKRMSQFVDIPIITGLGNARNNINILSSNIIIAIGSGPGTLSEIALAIKEDKPVIILNNPKYAEIILESFQPAFFYNLEVFNLSELKKILEKHLASGVVNS